MLFHAAFLLASIKTGLCWFLYYIGLADILDSERPWGDPLDHTLAAYSASANMIRGCLPLTDFGCLLDASEACDVVTCCAVCLSDFEKTDEIRQLRNCNHVFHKSCLDKWLDHDQKTCPLCRSCLMSETFQNDATAGTSWAVDRLLYLFDEHIATPA